MGLEFTAGTYTTPAGDNIDYWHLWENDDLPREGCSDIILRGYTSYADRETYGAAAMRQQVGPYRISGGDYAINMTEAAIYALVKTLEIGGIDFTQATDKNPDI